jgi:hypothetical protein
VHCRRFVQEEDRRGLCGERLSRLQTATPEPVRVRSACGPRRPARIHCGLPFGDEMTSRSVGLKTIGVPRPSVNAGGLARRKDPPIETTLEGAPSAASAFWFRRCSRSARSGRRMLVRLGLSRMCSCKDHSFERLTIGTRSRSLRANFCFRIGAAFRGRGVFEVATSDYRFGATLGCDRAGDRARAFCHST